VTYTRRCRRLAFRHTPSPRGYAVDRLVNPPSWPKNRQPTGC
jgi:hypothetical protein